jgi:hypothetical protein
MNQPKPTRITRITISGFGPLSGFSMDVGDLTVVFGRNESGKSSIVDALYAWFKREIRFREKQPIEVRIGEGYDGEVELEVSGDIKSVADLIKKHPHLLNLIFVPEGSADLSGSTDWMKDVKERLTGTDLAKVSEEIKSDVGMTPKKRESKDRKEEIQKLEDMKSQLESFFENIETVSRLQAELKTSIGKRDELARRRDDLRRARGYYTYKRLSEALRNRDEAKAKLRDYERYSENDLGSWESLESSAGELRGAHEARSKRLEDERTELSGQEESLKEAKAQKESANSKLDRAHRVGLHKLIREHKAISESISPPPVPLNFALIVTLLGLILGVAAVLGFARIPSGAISALMIVAGGLLYWIAAARQRESRKLDDTATKIAASAERIDLEGKEVEEIEKELESLEIQASRYEGTISALEEAVERRQNSVDELERDLLKLDQSLSEVRGKMNELRDRTKLGAISQLRERITEKRDLLRSIENARSILKEAFPEDPESQWEKKIAELECEDPKIEYSERRLQETEEELGETVGLVGRLESDLEKMTTWQLTTLGLSGMAEANARLEEIDEELRNLKIRWRAGELALSGIKKLSEDVDLSLKQALAPGEHTASHYFETFTRGRYTSVSASKDTGSIIVESQDEVAFPAEALSRGTRDQLFLAIRLAVIRRILGAPGFMIWDDAFLTADHDRKTLLVSAAVKLADSGWQILYLTVDRETRALFEKYPLTNVIELPPPA